MRSRSESRGKKINGAALLDQIVRSEQSENCSVILGGRCGRPGVVLKTTPVQRTESALCPEGWWSVGYYGSPCFRLYWRWSTSARAATTRCRRSPVTGGRAGRSGSRGTGGASRRRGLPVLLRSGGFNVADPLCASSRRLSTSGGDLNPEVVVERCAMRFGSHWGRHTDRTARRPHHAVPADPLLDAIFTRF